MYTLYYYPNNASLAPHFLLHHMQLPYELVLVDKKSNSQKSAEYLKLNPAGRIPTLIDDGQPIFESPAICMHLAESHPEHGLIPLVGDKARPLFLQWLAYLNNTLQAELMVYYYAHRHTNDEGTIENVKAAQEVQIANALSVIDEQLAKHKYLIGEQLTAVDYFLFMLAEWSLPVEKNPLTFPNLSAYLKSLSQHPTIQAVCKIEEMDITVFN
ncbi:putative Glutathione S-transferase [Vibrio nigripulchritudo SO65]|uniref:glutathione S-transferase family protein n=1 Tax=Vibrio nigripulchritudo TaxID=28173 RepID=UPI0003B19807|nr:glutathione S-transferase family protein [Vibrio nigripulchritudo]CCN33760.1 putative Glutathione S-transferase [Vibrio nigripulchritudo AM115]CCN41962.1 putative Glutathione S-transferase [Vibrio nigripulchritudo FTn2]CCN66246.1 putative Glutathione S-transferase [Vibrio nigripulchritudo POn4]CCN74604.1 putative Glutathione S-transferase [Vibrio nigripulchritudo SO65]